MAMLDQEHPDLPIPRNDHNAYTLGSIGRHNIVIACLPMGVIGNNSVTHVATQMVNTFPFIKFGLMVSIGGGIPPKVRLGDVVVSKPDGKFPGVVQWDFGKAIDGGKFEQTGSLDRPPKELLAALSKLVARHNMNKSDIPRFVEDLRTNPFLPPNYTRSDSIKDILFAADNPHRTQGRWKVLGSTVWETVLGLLAYLVGWWVFAPLKPGVDQNINIPSVIDLDGEQKRWVEANEDEEECRFCDTTRIIKRRPRATRVHYGLIASGNQVVKDARFRDALNKTFEGNILCLEMEAAGLLESFPCIVIRGICDYADSHKNRVWQDHAAAVAAAFAKELLSIVPARQVEQMPAIECKRPFDIQLFHLSLRLRT
jgi:nucleoside phosphorylase